MRKFVPTTPIHKEVRELIDYQCRTITPQRLTKRFQLNGYLSQASVADVQIGETFESTAAFFTRLKVTFPPVGDIRPHTEPNFQKLSGRLVWRRHCGIGILQ